MLLQKKQLSKTGAKHPAQKNIIPLQGLIVINGYTNICKEKGKIFSPVSENKFFFV